MTLFNYYGRNILAAVKSFANVNAYRALYNTATAMQNANIAAGNNRAAKHFENVAFAAMLCTY